MRKFNFYNVILIIIFISCVNLGTALNETASKSNLKASSISLGNMPVLERISLINSKIQEKNLSWIATETSMSSLSKEEKMKMIGYLPTKDVNSVKSKKYLSPLKGAPLSFIDWRNNNGNWVSSIKNQGGCGYCSIFSSVAVVESRAKIDLNNAAYNIDLSEQDAASCNPSSNGGICDGGTTDGQNEVDVLNYISNTGIVKESCFSYSGISNACSNKCSNWQNEKLKINSFQGISGVDSIKQAINDYGPVTVYMAVYDDFYDYGSGIYAWSYGDYVGLHSIAIVGYNDTGSYWICKNSWGSISWGESGYFRIAYSENVLDYWSWNPSLTGEFFLDDSYYVSGTDIATAPTVNSALANNTYAQNTTLINFSVYAKPNSIKQLSSVKINGTSMTGSLQYGGIFSIVKTPAQLGCTQSSEGTCTLIINATDDANKFSTEQIQIYVDDLAPRVTDITLNDLDGYVNSSQIFTVAVNVVDLGVSSVKINGSALSLVNSLYTLATNANSLGCIVNSVCNLTVVAIDNAGNINNSQKKQIVVDNLSPTVTLNYSSNYSWRSTTLPKLNYSFIDSLSPNASCILTINSVTYTSTVNNNTLKEVQVTGLTTNTAFPWYVTCTDLAGNSGTSNTWIVRIDTTSPVSSITLNNTANSNGWIKSPTLVNITATDTSGSGVNYTQWKNSSTGNWQNISNVFVLSENLSDNIIYYRSVDSVLNIELDKQQSFKYDSISPNITSVISSSNLIAASASFTIDVFAIDALSGLEPTATFLLDGVSGNLDYSSGKYSGISTAPSTDGVYNITTIVSDKAGNNISNSALQIRVNSTLPTINVNKVNGTIVSNNSVLTITFSGLGNAWYNYTGGIETSTNSSTAIVTISGGDKFQLWIWANNSVATINQNYTYNIDTTIPAISFSTPSANLTKVNGSIDILANASDSSGIASVTLAIEGTNFGTDTTLPYSFSLATTTYLDGLYTLTLTSIDNIGLTNSTALTINITNNQILTTVNVVGDTSSSAGTISSSDLANTPVESVLEGITGLNSTTVTITLLETVPNNPSNNQLSNIIEKINITAGTSVNSRVYVLVPKTTLVSLGLTSPYGRIAFYADHGAGVIGPLTSAYVDTITKNGIEYERFYFETSSYSLFFWGIQGETTSNGGGGGGTTGGGSGSGGGGGGGGGSGWSLTKTATENQIALGYNFDLSKNQRVQFNLSTEIHYVGIKNITESSIIIEIASNPISATLIVNETKKFEITNDEYYDIQVTLNSIVRGKANLTIKSISEQIAKNIIPSGETNLSQEKETNDNFIMNKKGSIIIFVIAIIVVLIVFVIRRLTKNKHKTKENE